MISQALVSWIHPEDYLDHVPTTHRIFNTSASVITRYSSSYNRFHNLSLPSIDHNFSYLPTNNITIDDGLSYLPTTYSSKYENHAYLPTNYSPLPCDNTNCNNIAPTPTINNVSLALLLYLFCFATVIGNALVIMAVYQVILSS